MDVKMELPNTELLARRIKGSDELGRFVAATCEKYMEPYVPMKTGALYQTTEIEPWQVTYLQPYAHYQYTGVNFNFTREFHPLATAYWDRACSVMKMEDISSEVSIRIKEMLADGQI